jgi:hypothetical protein
MLKIFSLKNSCNYIPYPNPQLLYCGTRKKNILGGTGSYYVAQAGLELEILLSQPPE